MFSVVEIIVSVYTDSQAEYKQAWAIAYDGKVIISSHSQAPDWSYDRAEVEQRLQEMLKSE